MKRDDEIYREVSSRLILTFSRSMIRLKKSVQNRNENLSEKYSRFSRERISTVTRDATAKRFSAHVFS